MTERVRSLLSIIEGACDCSRDPVDTNPRFIDSYAEYAVAAARMIAPKPKELSHIEAASIPVVAVTAWQMLFDHARMQEGQTVVVHGGGGNVGTYAVQLAHMSGLHVIATVHGDGADHAQPRGR
jgi:NADPH:quinone reductase-like Zn-dependent oxidoreductase